MGKQTFADELTGYEKPKRIWFDSLSADVKRELQDAKDKYIAGKLKVPKTVMYKKAREKFALTCSLTTFREWLRGANNG